MRCYNCKQEMEVVAVYDGCKEWACPSLHCSTTTTRLLNRKGEEMQIGNTD